MSATNLAFYSNSDLDTVSAQRLRALMDNVGLKFMETLKLVTTVVLRPMNFVALNQDTTVTT